MSEAINKMTTGDILNEVQSEIPELSDTKQVYRAINRVIRDINTEYPGVETTENVITTIDAKFTSAVTYTATDADPDIIDVPDDSFADFPSGEAAEDWAGYYLVISDSASNDGYYEIATTDDSATEVITLAEDEAITAVTETAKFQVIQVDSNYAFDTENLLLTLSKYCREVLDLIYYDGSNTYQLTKEPIKIVEEYSSDDEPLYASKYMYARYDRNKILFPAGLLEYPANGIMKVKILKDIQPLSKVSGAISSSTTITLPLSMEQVLVNGVFYYLYSMPKYSNENLWKINERAYMDGLGKAKQSEARNIQEKQE